MATYKILASGKKASRVLTLLAYKKLTAVALVISSFVVVFGWNLAQVSASVPGVNEHADKTSSGTIGNSSSGIGQLSHDGRYVTFESSSSNLVSGDTNSSWDIFVRDRTSNTITRVSVSSSGTQGNGGSNAPAISDDGRYVVFASDASNLVSGDTNGATDVFLHDMQTGTTQLLSDSSAGTLGNGSSSKPDISGDGKFVAFSSSSTNLVSPATTTGRSNIYVKNIATGNIQLVSKNSSGSEGNNSSFSPSISCDGGTVAFGSAATNLVTGSDTNGSDDIFVVVRAGGDSVQNITLGSDQGADYPDVSCDGMHVAFVSSSTNLVSGDTNSQTDIFKYDRRDSSTELVSIDSSGNQANSYSTDAVISSDGRLVAFGSAADNLVSGDTNGVNDVFMRDTVTNATYRVSVNGSGQQGNAASFEFSGSSFSGDGKSLYFTSGATNLITSDTGNTGGGFIAETGL